MEKITLKKDERLCSQKLIGELFSSGESFLSYPLKVVFLKSELPGVHSAQVSFSVSKRNFKRAVKRNLLKRRMREAYRLNKPAFLADIASKNVKIAMMFIFVGKEMVEYTVIEKATISAFKKIVAKI